MASLATNELNTPDSHGWFPILRLCAVREGYSVSQLKSLIRRGADVTVRNQRGRTALHLACGTGKPAFVIPLLDAGADIDAVDEVGHTPLHAAVQGSNKAIGVLLERGARIDAIDKAGMSPLVLACEIGKVGAIQELCRRGANIRILTPAGTGLVGLVLDSVKSIFPSSALDMLRALLAAGAEVNNPEYETGDTEVHKAASKLRLRWSGSEQINVVKMVIRAGGNPWQQNRSGQSALDYLEDTHIVELQRVLKAYLKGREFNIVRNIRTVKELKAFFQNQTKFSRKEVYELLPGGTPAKECFHEALALPAVVIEPKQA